MPKGAPGSDKVVFGQVENEDGFRVMAYDIPGRSEGSAGSAGSTHRENGATITDMLTDGFGVTWVLDVAPAHSGE